jgi:hypothetical protein
MPEKYFILLPDDIIPIVVFFKSDGKSVVSFVVKFQYYANSKWLKVARYDCYHDVIHKDIFDRQGKKRRVIAYPYLDEKAGLTVAILDFKENCDSIIQRFLNKTY